MEVAALGPLLSGGLLVVSVVLLAGLCVSCRKSSHRTSIQQYFSEDDYVQQSHTVQGGFRVVRPACPAPPVSSRGSGHSTHLPFDTSPVMHQTRRSSFNPNDTGGIIPKERPSTPQDDDYVNEDNDDDDEEVKGEGYIEVLPDPPADIRICVSQQSLASTQSSGQGNYVNVKEEDGQSDASSQNYINVNAEEHAGFHRGVSLDSFGNFDSDNNSVSDYVNTSEFNTTPVTGPVQ
ncbi:linker for activation of T-cells family member 1 [Megalops cyprinoides]|uniref:linker for activation of T-cells family member 1 n=1 Tax=Megalops cyprinoides TaxID=118141 RepID=UPI00186555CE|nr:linker for activation of T-cells family member 1 [Megalops cyprinoides]